MNNIDINLPILEHLPYNKLRVLVFDHIKNFTCKGNGICNYTTRTGINSYKELAVICFISGYILSSFTFNS